VEMKKYVVTYTVEIEVWADSEANAVHEGIRQWEKEPDGYWNAELVGER